jgi:hypothetical protein
MLFGFLSFGARGRSLILEQKIWACALMDLEENVMCMASFAPDDVAEMVAVLLPTT